MKFLRLFSRGVAKKKLWPAFVPGQTNATTFQLKEADLNQIEENILRREHSNNVPRIRELLFKINSSQDGDANINNLHKELLEEFRKLPNDTDERVLDYGREAKITYLSRASSTGSKESKVEQQKSQDQLAYEFSVIGKYFNSLRMEHLSNFTGHKSYYLFGMLAQLEQALIRYALTILKQNGFRLISVPDILPPDIIQSCGMQTEGDRTQVYKLNSGDCLSGTSEMAIASFFANNKLSKDELPLKVAAVSRCFRAETSGLSEEKGIYRVHQFNKVEMFSICLPSQSEQMLETFKDIEISIFESLKLDLRLLDMPAYELGTQAFRKYDIECWMPGRKMWGEISSCSNCTDYQSKRLNICLKPSGNLQTSDNCDDNLVEYVHTINGTAAAIPRLLIAIIESNQTNEGTVRIPEILREWLNGDELIKEKRVPALKLVKHIRSPEIV